MKITYFLRGMGVGIIFASVILFISFKTTPATMSNEDIISRAKQLGMVEAPRNNDLDGILSSDASSDASGDATSDKKKDDSEKLEKKNENDAKGESDTKDQNTDTDKKESEKKAEKDLTESKATTELEEITEAEVTTEQAAGGQVTFSIHSGEYSEELSQNLYSLGVVKDADDFNRYLCSTGYASRLHVGTYTVTKGEDYASIASKIIQ